MMLTPNRLPRRMQYAALAAALAIAGPCVLAQTDATQTPTTYAAGSSNIPDPRTPPPSRPGAYTLAQVLDMTRAKNLTLLAAERNLRAVKAQEIQAGVRVNPNFTLAASNVSEPATENNPYSYAFQVSRLF